MRQLLSHQAGGDRHPADGGGARRDAAFFTPGLGDSLGMADPDTGIGYCYAPNRLGYGLIDQREFALRDAPYRDVLGERSQKLG